MPGAPRARERVELRALPGVPVVEPGADLAALAWAALERAELTVADGDVLAVASKLVSRAEGRFVDVSTVTPSARARELGAQTGKDPREVELVLRESTLVSRARPGALIVRHRAGVIGANAGIDFSNARPSGAPEGSGPWALLLPEDADESAERLRGALAGRSGAALGVVVTDSLGRPFRLGSVGVAVGVAGLPALFDQRGRTDLFGRVLEHTVTAFADQVAAAADLIAGQADEGRAMVLVRGLEFGLVRSSARELCREPESDLYVGGGP
ncbi:MAG: coenzyme F420-0:L-glutamate ligase [Sorangiineae bacterium]|nr:coenzyme F420-0:L-glutamate ligase [Polyangiaceae bacterium]MEB2323848.1 coenzyme F420-0:L-glutamate ligase [Sorangiineae bacterium]